MNTSELEILYRMRASLQRLHRLVQNRPSTYEMPVELKMLIEETLSDVCKALGINEWPEPTVERPDFETLEEWLWEDGGCEATDGCFTDPDGTCPHGHPSWFLKLGLI